LIFGKGLGIFGFDENYQQVAMRVKYETFFEGLFGFLIAPIDS